MMYIYLRGTDGLMDGWLEKEVLHSFFRKTRKIIFSLENIYLVFIKKINISLK